MPSDNHTAALSTAALTAPRLLADIGGTNARFGLQAEAGAPIGQVRSYACADYPSLESAASAYLEATDTARPRHCAIGIATPITGDQVKMTNHPWSFSQAELRGQLGLERLVVINDFTALALAVPALGGEALRQVGGQQAVRGAAMGLIGPGTGLGVSGLLAVPGSDGYLPIQGEGGHVTLGGETEVEIDILARLRKRHSHVSAERVICGPGLAELTRCLAEVRGVEVPPDWSAADVVQRATAGGDALCNEAIDLFCGWLGQVAGNLALTLGARGGMYIGGGMVPRLGRRFDGSPFRQRFEAKGRFQGYLAPIPVFVIDDRSQPALLGAARALETRLS